MLLGRSNHCNKKPMKLPMRRKMLIMFQEEDLKHHLHSQHHHLHPQLSLNKEKDQKVFQGHSEHSKLLQGMTRSWESYRNGNFVPNR